VFFIIPSFLQRLSSSRERGQDFGWGFAGSVGQGYSFDGVGRYHDAPSVKPIANVFLCRSPLQILNSIVRSIFILVMDDRKIEGVGNESCRDKSVDGNRPDSPLNRKFHFGVAVGPDANDPDAGPRVASFGASVNVPSHALDSTNTTNLVQALVSANRAPFLSRLTNILNLWKGARKKLFNGGFNIELFGSLSVSRPTEINHQVAVVVRDREQSCSKDSLESLHAVFRHPRKAPYTKLIRYFVLSFVAGDRKPFFSRLVHRISPVIWLLPKNMGRYMVNYVSCQLEKLTSNFKGLLPCQSR
jgi:hypothetical protein